jgi:hypothetical protein
MELPEDFVMQPLWDYCILEIPEDEKSLIIRPKPEDATKIGTLELKVLFTGPEVRNIKPGDRLIFNPQASIPFSYQDKQYFLISERATGVVVAPLRRMKEVPDGKPWP